MNRHILRIILVMLVLATTLGTVRPAVAEPWIAVQAGFKCVQCHVNPTGGGQRNAFGNAYAQTSLSARRIGPEDAEPWTGTVNQFLSVGGNARVNAAVQDVPDVGSDSAFDLQEVRLYLDAAVIPQRLSVQIDERIAPGGALNLQANVLFWLREGSLYLKAGQMYMPYGLRLEDDSAFVRQVPGLNMNTPDSGVEFGMESANWSAQLAIANGSGSATENNDGKLVVARAEFVRPVWRAGISASRNGIDAGERWTGGLFAGVRTGPIAWLAEADWIDDDALGTTGRTLLTGLLEANWLISKGQNLKLTAEYFDPDNDVDEDEQTRFSAVWEYFPFQFLQFRAGARVYDGIPQAPLQNRREYFLQLHAYF